MFLGSHDPCRRWLLHPVSVSSQLHSEQKLHTNTTVISGPDRPQTQHPSVPELPLESGWYKPGHPHV